MVSVFIDTNIFLYLISGDNTVANFLNDKTVYLSFITELELFGFKELNVDEKNSINSFLADTTIIDINSSIKNLVIELRKSSKIKLPDAIIAASAQFLNMPLMTADAQISKLKEVNVLFYEK